MLFDEDEQDDKPTVQQIPKSAGTSIFIRQTRLPETLASLFGAALDEAAVPPTAGGGGGSRDAIRKLVSERERELLNYQAASKHDAVSLTLRERILLSNAPPDVKTLLFRKLREAYGQTGDSPTSFPTIHSSGNSETSKLLGWIEVVLSLPFGIYKPIIVKGVIPGGKPREVDILSHLRSVKESLDKHVYKHDRAKASILGYVARVLYSQSKSNVVLLLNGPPAVGKTRLARFVATALGLPFQSLSLAQIRDASIVVGHSPTYVGARPGRIALSLIQSKSLRSVLFLDELDKILTASNNADSSGTSSDVTSVLLQAMDPECASEWDADCFLSPIKLDLSQVVWIAACNKKDLLSPILLDRAWVIDIEPLSFQDRVEIVKRIVLPEALQELGMTDRVAPLSHEAATYILTAAEKVKEGGMRDLKRRIGRMLERLMLIQIAANAGEGSLGEIFPFAKRPMPALTCPLQFTPEWVDYLSWEPDDHKKPPPDHFSMYS